MLKYVRAGAASAVILGLLGLIHGPIPYPCRCPGLVTFHATISPELVGIGMTVLLLELMMGLRDREDHVLQDDHYPIALDEKSLEPEVVAAQDQTPFEEVVELDRFPSPAQPATAEDIYGIDVAFLVTCWLWLMQAVGQAVSPVDRRTPRVVVGHGPEWACLITGPRMNGTRFLTEMIPVRFAQQSMGGVALDLGDFHRALRGMQRWGYSLHAVFHSHRFRGPVSPSQIDLDTQTKLLEPTFPAIQGIFSEDGYIRFFAVERHFAIQVYGEGVEHVDDTLYRLADDLRAAALAETVWSPLVPTG